MCDVQCSADGPERWIQMDSLKEYHGKPLRGCSVPGDCHDMAFQTDTMAIISSHKDVPFSLEGGGFQPHRACCLALAGSMVGGDRTNAQAIRVCMNVSQGMPISTEEGNRDSDANRNSQGSESAVKGCRVEGKRIEMQRKPTNRFPCSSYNAGQKQH